MSTVEMTQRIKRPSSRSSGRFVGAYYMLTILTGVFVMLFHGRWVFVADLIATAFYITLTALFFASSRLADRNRALREHTETYELGSGSWRERPSRSSFSRQ